MTLLMTGMHLRWITMGYRGIRGLAMGFYAKRTYLGSGLSGTETEDIGEHAVFRALTESRE